ncbi:transposase domain-containing protein [uncultured Desulfobacter sp.]|uniref:transposase domain-containing protein n=1 Tax=uncultured Desulfobacter sp. TaxID=240139 RepID=UPI002AAAA596|nr:transposase domain-containing protein [uncultured Desulfobacter sp.]
MNPVGKVAGLEPYWYLKHLFGHLPEAMTEENFRALRPYNVDKNQLASTIVGLEPLTFKA